MSFPTYFISHGGGPWPWIKDQMPGVYDRLEASLKSIPQEIGATPKAILAISGHWETRDFTVQANPHPPMVYDYGGFPEFTYQIQYPAPGSPQLAGRVRDLLSMPVSTAGLDEERGYDHGVFAPFFAIYPEANVPIVQLSILSGYDPATHLAAGRALANLRDEGILIVGSGLSYHNLREFGARGAVASSRVRCLAHTNSLRNAPCSTDPGTDGLGQSSLCSPGAPARGSPDPADGCCRSRGKGACHPHVSRRQILRRPDSLELPLRVVDKVNQFR